MRFPLSLTTALTGYLLKKRFSGQQRFPLVLMLEPLHACNLTCTGCGRIREYAAPIKQADVGRGVPRRGRRVRRADRQHLRRRADDLSGNRPACARDPRAPASTFISAPTACSSRRSLHEFKPTSRLFFNVHLDGMEETHDLAVEREGSSRRPSTASRRPSRPASGLHQHDLLQGNRHGRDRRLLGYLTELGVDGFMISPALRL